MKQLKHREKQKKYLEDLWQGLEQGDLGKSQRLEEISERILQNYNPEDPKNSPGFRLLFETAMDSVNPRDRLDLLLFHLPQNSPADHYKTYYLFEAAIPTFIEQGQAEDIIALHSEYPIPIHELEYGVIGNIVRAAYENPDHMAQQIPLLHDHYAGKDPDTDYVLLTLSAEYRNAEILQQLLEQGVAFLSHDYEVVYELFNGDHPETPACLKAFLEHGLDPHHADIENRPLLSYVLEASNATQIIQAMEDAGFDYAAKDHHGRTLLHLAVIENDQELCEHLIESGKLDLNALDNFGNTAFALAACKGIEHLFPDDKGIKKRFDIDNAQYEVEEIIAGEQIARETIYQFSHIGALEYPGIALDLAVRQDQRQEKLSKQDDVLGAEIMTRPLNAYVLLDGEFDEFLSLVLQMSSMPQAEKPIIIEAVTQYDSEHWGCMDIEVLENGKTNICFIDSLADIGYIEPLIGSVARYFPDAEIYFNTDKLQGNSLACAAFSIDGVAHLSNQDDLYDYLSARKEELIQTDGNPSQGIEKHEVTVTIPNEVGGSKDVTVPIYQVNLPPRLVRTMQSTSRLAAREADNGPNLIVNKKGETFNQSIPKNLVLESVEGQEKPVNRRIEYKLSREHDKLAAYTEGKTRSELENTITSVSIGALRERVEGLSQSEQLSEKKGKESEGKKPIFGKHTERLAASASGKEQSPGWCNLL